MSKRSELAKRIRIRYRARNKVYRIKAKERVQKALELQGKGTNVYAW